MKYMGMNGWVELLCEECQNFVTIGIHSWPEDEDAEILIICGDCCRASRKFGQRSPSGSSPKAIPYGLRCLISKECVIMIIWR